MNDELKCDTCIHVKQYTLADDECGAGSTVFHCAKGHWENSPPEEFDDIPTQDIIDFYRKCEDYGKRTE